MSLSLSLSLPFCQFAQDHQCAPRHSFKAWVLQAAPVIDAGGIFDFARQSGMIKKKEDITKSEGVQ
jgi:hypothetical protein